ncbi:MAG: aldolase [Alphaproteobacteria bacterium]|nr:aldolase [Alphaproteobacteria bacterium]
MRKSQFEDSVDTRVDPRWQARVDLAAAFRLAVRFGLHEGICNHFSMLLPGARDRFLLNPYGLHWSEITASRLIVIDPAGNTVEGDGMAEATAYYIHSRIHLAAPHATVVLHTHQPYATALTMVDGGRLEPCVQSAVRFYGRIAYDDSYNGVALDNAEGDRMAGLLGDKEVMFLANHGVITTAPDVATAFDALYYLERAAQAQIIAQSTGQPLRKLSDNFARVTNAQMMPDVPAFARRHFASLKRILDRDEPDYAT